MRGPLWRRSFSHLLLGHVSSPMVPKTLTQSTSGGTRPLGIPTVADRVGQEVVRLSPKSMTDDTRPLSVSSPQPSVRLLLNRINCGIKCGRIVPKTSKIPPFGVFGSSQSILINDAYE